MTKYVIFDLNGTVAFFDDAANKSATIAILAAEDDSYAGLDPLRVHELSNDESRDLETWIEGGQKTHEWPFDWRAS